MNVDGVLTHGSFLVTLHHQDSLFTCTSLNLWIQTGKWRSALCPFSATPRKVWNHMSHWQQFLMSMIIMLCISVSLCLQPLLQHEQMHRGCTYFTEKASNKAATVSQMYISQILLETEISSPLMTHTGRKSNPQSIQREYQKTSRVNKCLHQVCFSLVRLLFIVLVFM